jgi:hypothetical protein
MATSILPALIDALVAGFRTALPDVTVYDGYGASEDVGNYLMVGVEDPNDASAATSATSEQSMGPMGTRRSRDEVGDITCVALCWTGDVDQKLSRDAAFAMTAAVENFLRADPRLGDLPGLLSVEYGSRTSLAQNVEDAGAQAWLVFTVHFKARI